MKPSTTVSLAATACALALSTARWAASQSIERSPRASMDRRLDAGLDTAALALSADADASITDAASATGCPDDTLAVRGTHCDELSEQCLEWASNGRGQCLRFAPDPRCTGRRLAVDVCMDRYEWPNQRGALPSVMVSYEAAEALCAARGRRLCTEDEWAFACSGEALLPYPYGRERSADACTVDLFARAPNRALLHSSDHAARNAEVERVYMASPSGSRPLCRSVFGVHDLTGNVDEWVRSTRSYGQPSALMGGFWGHVRNRCRAVTRAHGPRFSYYQIGFRCCVERAR